jgi:DNA-binding CsgD family transcriptional regulator
MTEALELIGRPAAVLRPDRIICAANRRFQRLAATLAIDPGNRLRLVDPAADAVLANVLRRLDHSHDRQEISSLPLSSRGRIPPMILHVFRLWPVHHREDCAVFIIATLLARRPPPDAKVLASLFNLTTAEARIARGISQGQAVGTIAEALGVSRQTVRSHLKAVFAKTGARRQVELAVLLAGAALPGPDD